MTVDNLKSSLLKDWPMKLFIAILTAFFGFTWSQTRTIIHAKVIEIVQPEIDSLSKAQELTDQRVETVQQDIEKLNDKVDALISILVESSPQIKKAAQARVQKNRDSQDVKNALTGSVSR